MTLPNITHMPTELTSMYGINPIAMRTNDTFCFPVISANSFVPVWSDLRYIHDAINKSEKIPINISAREYQLMLNAKL
jgi:hypothetical protein